MQSNSETDYKKNLHREQELNGTSATQVLGPKDNESATVDIRVEDSQKDIDMWNTMAIVTSGDSQSNYQALRQPALYDEFNVG